MDVWLYYNKWKLLFFRQVNFFTLKVRGSIFRPHISTFLLGRERPVADNNDAPRFSCLAHCWLAASWAKPTSPLCSPVFAATARSFLLAGFIPDLSTNQVPAQAHRTHKKNNKKNCFTGICGAWCRGRMRGMWPDEGCGGHRTSDLISDLIEIRSVGGRSVENTRG